MVDAIGSKPVTGGDRPAAPAASVAPPAEPSRIVPAAGDPAAHSPAGPAVGAVIRDLAAGPPVDFERVARIRQAIADGTYPIVPETIADRLIALKLEWKPNDPS